MSESIAIYAIFHLNLAFSSIEEADHERVIEQCYWPLLRLIDDEKRPLALELSVYTLERINDLSPGWVATFKRLLASGQCELLASGDSQIIGPLIPARVNAINLALGQEAYQRLLGTSPSIAYINEQAVSSGLLDIYIDQGFNAVVVEWDNPYSHNPNWDASLFMQPQQLISAQGRQIPVIWNHAIAFQKLQRYAHGEFPLHDHLNYLASLRRDGMRCLSVYGNDAEIFNYRPGRYRGEAQAQFDEWSRINDLFQALAENSHYRWCTPSNILAMGSGAKALTLTNAAHPVSVKKQAKYNITRWALSGRNDLALNTECHRQYQLLCNNAQSTQSEWRELCRFWASDLRTHLTETRYQKLSTLPRAEGTKNPSAACVPLKPDSLHELNIELHTDHERGHLRINSPEISLVLNMRRGLSIVSLRFHEQAEHICGTLAQGYFDHILYGADFYSGHLVMERFLQRDRLTDLLAVNPIIGIAEQRLIVSTEISTAQGTLEKYYLIDGHTLRCGFLFKEPKRPECSLRLAFISFFNCQQRLWFASHLGSNSLEYFDPDSDFDHGQPVSSIVSASSAIGASEGVLYAGVGEHALKLQWNPAHCAAIPMASSKRVRERYLNRVWFSLVEADETLKAGGDLLPFELRISAHRRSALY